MLRIISLGVPRSTHVPWQVPVSVDFVLTSSALGVIDLMLCPHEYGLSKEGTFEVCCVIVRLRVREERCIRGAKRGAFEVLQKRLETE